MSLSVSMYMGSVAIVGLVLAVVLTKWRRTRTQGDDEPTSEMATDLWNLPPLTPPSEECAPPDLDNAKVPSPEQPSGSAADSLGAAPKQFEAALDRVSKPEGATPRAPEAAQPKAPIPNVVRREQGPEPVHAVKPAQGPRVIGRHHLVWEVVGAGTDGPGLRLSEPEALEPNTEQSQPAPHAVTEKPNHTVTKELDGAASSLIEQTRTRLEGEVPAALETFSREVDARLQALEQEPSIAKLRAEMTEQLQRQLSDVRDAAGEAHQDLVQRADAAVEKMDLAVETAAGKLRTIEHQTEVRLADIVDALRKTSDDLIASATKQLEGQAAATGERVTEELRAVQTRLMEEVDKQLGTAIQARVESLNGKAEAFTEECRRRLRQELDEGVRKSLQELEADSRKFLERQRESVQRLLDERLGAAIQASRESLKRETQAIMVECRGRLLQEVDAAVAASAPKRGAERETLPMTPPEPVARPRDVYPARPSGLRQQWTQLHEGPPRLRAFLHATSSAAVWLIPVAPILVFVILSTRPVMHLRTDPPAEFFVGRQDSSITQRATEERLARAYWDTAVQYVEPKHQFGTSLPAEPVVEFDVAGTAARGGNSKSDSDTRRRYWQKLRQVWVLPQAWQKSYVWDTGWIDAAVATLRSAGR